MLNADFFEIKIKNEKVVLTNEGSLTNADYAGIMTEAENVVKNMLSEAAE